MFRALLLFLFAASTRAALVVDEECLNYTIYPVQYDITIIPYIYKDRAFYDCHISITVIANAPNIRMIELEAKNMTINGETIKVYKGNQDIVNGPRPYSYDKGRGKLNIYLSEPLIPYKGRYTQNYVIRMSFRKEVTYENTGIFLVRYVDEYGMIKYLVQTRLSPDNGKYFIPCFDNPRFESVFKFTVYEIPADSHVQYTNTSLVIAQESQRETLPDRRIAIHYSPSPQISMYQVGFHLSLFSNVQASSKYTNDTIVIWAPAQDIKNCYFILNFCQNIIDMIHEYSTVNRTLVTGPINIIGIPANVNGYEIASWNLLTNNVIRILYKPEFISVKQLEQMKFELTQQLCRIWLGNPGEPARTRWKEEWFKEGVATYLAFYFLAQYDGGAQHSYHRSLGQYGLEIKHSAMFHDWHHTTPPLVSFNKDLAVNIPGRYKELVTMKTASLLWMVENWLGAEKFHQALIKYINGRRGMYISLEDFMVSLDHDTVECSHQFFNGSTASKILNSWFHHSGYPVINVQVIRHGNVDVIQLKQKRFSLAWDGRHETDYLIPISYVIQNVSNCYNCYRPRFTIGKQKYAFEENLNNGWIILNRNAAGYYLVNYDEHTWKLIADTLKQDPNLIDEMNRAQIVHDVFALCASGDMSEGLGMRVLEFLGQDRSEASWSAAAAGLALMRQDSGVTTRVSWNSWQNFMRNKVATIYKILMNSIEQGTKTRRFRSTIKELACSMKYQKCLDYADHLQWQWRTKNQRFDPDSRRACYYVAYSSGKGLSVTDRFNAYEEEDRWHAENMHRRESYFLAKIPKGEPRPENIAMTTPEPEHMVSSEKITLADTGGRDKSVIQLSSVCVIVISTFVTFTLR